MHTTTHPRRVSLAHAAALLAIFSVVSISSRQVVAQLGRLVVTMTSPSSGSTVSGTVTASASVSIIGALTVGGVQFKLDGVNLGAEDTTAPYSIPWNTTTASNGSHTLTAVARDLLGIRWTSNSVTVTVFNDKTSPTVSISAPTSGSTVRGTVAVNAIASDNVGVAGVQFRLDGANLGTEDTTAPYSISWNTTTVSNASHTLTAVARDAAGNRTTSAPIAVTVSSDTSPPAVTITAPSPGAFVRGTITITANASDNVGVAGVQFLVDGAPLGAEDTTAPYSVTWNTTTASNSAHALTARARDAAANAATSVALTVTVDNALPTVTIASPAGGATVSGSVTVTASASDNNGVAGVQFRLDGASLGAEDTAAPYSVSWNTASVANGSHTLTALARDGAGNTATSAGVSVTVSNVTPPPTSTPTRFEETDLSIIYTAGTTGPGQPPDWWHGSRSREWTLGTASFNRSAGARATFSFTGTSVTWIGFRAPWAGIARVFVDGTFITELDLYQTTEQPQATVFSATNLAAGSHTLAVESTGRKNASSVDYAVVVDAFDVSPASPPPTGTRFEETSSAMSFTAGWTQGDKTRAWSGATAAVSATPGARAVFTFGGTSVRWVGLSGPQTGIARIFLDGAFQGQVDTYAPAEVQAVVFAVTGLAAARHRLEIEVTGEKDAAATNSTIVVDAFDIRPRIEETDPSVTYSGVWTAQDTIRAYSGTSFQTGGGMAARSETAGARAQFAFTGTSVSWIGVRGPWVGIADVFLDGALAARVDLYSPTDVVQATVFSASGLSAGPHTLRVDVTGAKNAASSSAFVVVDAFDVPLPATAPIVSRVQESDASISYSSIANWPEAGITPLWSGENARWSTTAGTRATFTFTGTSVRWIGERGFGSGVARISLDGSFVAQVDTQTPLQEEYQATLFAATGLTPGGHTLTIDVIGRNNEPPGATVERVVVDAFDVY
jgi:YD repeat-containing protein